MVKAVLFDLDDTLYPEYTFVKSGFQAVAQWVAQNYCINSGDIEKRLWSIIQQEGRGQVFDLLLKELNLDNSPNVYTLIHRYRTHWPKIQLFPQALDLLQGLRAKDILLGLVTDGQATVQHRKVAALSLESELDVIICTDDIGRKHWKPSVVPFTVALDVLGVKAGEAVYVGDDSRKDFEGPNYLGIRTVHYSREGEAYRLDEFVTNSTVAEHLIHNLEDLPKILEVL